MIFFDFTPLPLVAGLPLDGGLDPFLDPLRLGVLALPLDTALGAAAAAVIARGGSS